jgi:hypothetical protein
MKGLGAGRGIPAPAPNPADKLHCNRLRAAASLTAGAPDRDPSHRARRTALNACPIPPLPPTFPRLAETPPRLVLLAQRAPRVRERCRLRGLGLGRGYGRHRRGSRRRLRRCPARGCFLRNRLRSCLHCRLRSRFRARLCLFGLLPLCRGLARGNLSPRPLRGCLAARLPLCLPLGRSGHASVSFCGPLGRLHGWLPTSPPRMLKHAATVKHGTPRNSRATVIDSRLRERATAGIALQRGAE